MDALGILKQDHDDVRALFDELEASNRRSLRARERIFDALRAELETHTRVEEDVLYPALRDSDSERLREMAQRSLEEHRVVKDLLEDMEELSPSDDEFAEAIAVLRDVLLRHAAEEERDVFPEMRQALGRERLTELGRALRACRHELSLQPAYR